MKPWCLSFLIALFSSATYAAPADPIVIGIAGDSTVSPYPAGSVQRGWGEFIQPYFSSQVTVVNLAKPGRSTKTFLAEGLWRELLARKPAIVLIQFGHNDSHSPGHPEATAAQGEYKGLLARFVKEARAIGAEPILITPVQRRSAVDGLMAYSDAMKQVAVATGTKLIDLHRTSGELYAKLGPERTAALEMTHDHTHFNAEGARQMAAIVMDGLLAARPELRAALIRSAAVSSEEVSVLHQERDLSRGFDEGDGPLVDRLLAPDFHGLDPDGSRYGRASMIHDAAGFPGMGLRLRTTDVTAHVSGEVAITEGVDHFLRGGVEARSNSWTDTWVRHGASWQLLAAADVARQADAKGADLTADEAAILKARRGQNDSLAAGHFDDAAKYWTEDVTLRRGLGAAVAGAAAYRAALVTASAGAQPVFYVRDPLNVEASHRWPLAFETGEWEQHMGSVTGPVAIRGKYSAQWVKRDGHWLIRSEVFVALESEGEGAQAKATP
jgi:lysophospholipase L1-like esterase